jgi:hypothetical protein
MSDTYFCRQVLHDGDGPVGPERKVCSTTRFEGAADAAEFFASELLDEEMRREHITQDDIGQFDQTHVVVEVRRSDSEDWQRFRVHYHIEVKCSAQPARCLKCGWPLHADIRHGCTPTNCSQRTKQ